MGTLTENTLAKIREQGRTYFDKEENLRELDELKMDPNHIGELVKGLSFEDKGLKQPCTALAVILKIGRQYPEESIEILEQALRREEAPTHYLCELIYKIHKKQEAHSRSILGAR